MNAVDGSAHVPQDEFAFAHDEVPSLLVIVLDTSPVGWSRQSEITLHEAVAALLIFINSHLALSPANEVAVVAAHANQAKFLYPPQPEPKLESQKLQQQQQQESQSVYGLDDEQVSNGSESSMHDQNKPSSRSSSMYKQFRVVNEAVLEQLGKLIESTKADDIERSGKVVDTTSISGALSIALAYINRLTGGLAVDTAVMRARMFVFSVASELASQYVAIMNCIFAAQKMKIPIDVCKLGVDAVFLQQASDTTGGIYIHLNHPKGLIQYLTAAFMPDRTLRKHLILPTQSSVDFRAACFCHKRVVDIGYVCNICLSIFCQPPADGSCAICDTVFDANELADLMKRPVVIGKKKVKRKKRKEPEMS
ncbi:TFIIH subunit Tfb4/p34 [Lipomyces japonicus]|uniref:TFIIH subunit Tfb4/p34 n=1 Tax=Lipomyces japonicus TaxID=56871 RepID=UPI0034CD5E22